MKKQLKVSIPKPCHEDWSKMTPKEKGRFCSSCSKTVIDFTQKSQQEIQDFLTENHGKKVCGHFYRRQLDSIVLEIPTATFQRPLTYQKLFLLALLFSMGTTLFSCQNSNGKIQKIENVILADSSEVESNFVLGGVPRSESALGTPMIDSLPQVFPPPTDSIPEIEIIDGLVITTGEVIEEPLDFHILESIDNPPRFIESKNLSNRDAKKDFKKKVQAFFTKRFKAPQADLGLPTKKHRIFSIFTINGEGKVIDVRVKAPHPMLKEQVESILNQLPDFIPGKHEGETVKMRYNLPILFEVE